MNVTIDGSDVTHRVECRTGRGDASSVTTCRIWFVGYKSYDLHDDPRGHVVETPVDCMTCLVRMAQSGLQ